MGKYSASYRRSARMAGPECETCHSTTRRLQVHHKDENPLNNDPLNLVTLCASCHSRSHSRNFTGMGAQRARCAHCDKPSMKGGLCYTHTTRRKRFGHPLAKKKKVGSQWVLMFHDGASWLPFQSSMEPPTELAGLGPTATRSTPNKPAPL